jgi:hypothetical protein
MQPINIGLGAVFGLFTVTSFPYEAALKEKYITQTSRRKRGRKDALGKQVFEKLVSWRRSAFGYYFPQRYKMDRVALVRWWNEI